MKKIITILLTLVVVVSLAACTRSNKPTGTSSPDVESSTFEETPTQESSTDDYEAKSDAMQTMEETESETEEISVLVAYFSATNTTEGVAEYVADGFGADLYKILPEDSYTDADLNYNNDGSRATIEMNDPSARPAISGSVENMEQYDIVFIGYPIWWGDAPRIVSTFMENYNFSGKTIVPFCTSGSSGIGLSAANLEELTNGAEWLPGQRLDGSSSRDEIVEWVNSLGLAVTAE